MIDIESLSPDLTICEEKGCGKPLALKTNFRPMRREAHMPYSCGEHDYVIFYGRRPYGRKGAGSRV